MWRVKLHSPCIFKRLKGLQHLEAKLEGCGGTGSNDSKHIHTHTTGARTELSTLSETLAQPRQLCATHRACIHSVLCP